MSTPPDLTTLEQYVNSDQRDVHVWCSVLANFQPNTSRRLVGGCSTGGNLNYLTFFGFLNVVINGHGTGKFIPESFEYALVKSHGNPLVSGTTFFPGINARLPNIAFPESDIIDIRQTTKRDDPVTVGHYYLLRCYGAPESREYRSTLIYNLPVAFITSRTLSRSGTASASETQSKKNEGHSEKTRNNVRLRDRRCRMTGSVVRQRNRGYNFTGFQVAHIFPIGWVPSIPRPPTHELQSIAFLVSKEMADDMFNAILMTATAHCLFDDYQIGIHPDCLEQITYDNKTYWARRLYRFEKDGAYDLQNCNYLHPPASMGQQLSVDYIIPNVQEPNDDLLRHHFETCILWHVSGAGKTPKLG